jgi:serine/threonine protein kinase/WD40 repeat protein
MPQPSEREIEVFNAALELPAAERVAYLDQACAGDAALRRRVEELLQAEDKAGAFLESPAAVPPRLGGTIQIAQIPAEKPGDRIGRYKLREKIGEGGCGVVYVAEQEEPVRRKVALKVIKLGMDTKNVIARFEAERQALAMMDHPNIAKVLDAGATDAGRPYFVMELVRGIKITDYCDQNQLSTPERLELFIKVCQAVQHAHQKGIIHRDIKPSNILVTLHDGVPVPKIIDFGISKATEGRLSDLTVYTELRQFIGTPAYMSPEQTEISGLDIDTRTDIYSLGVLLYELLTGGTPFDPKELLKSGLDQMRKIIRESDPPRPSTRLSTMLEADLSAIALRHGAESPKLIHLVRGDLDWIVMKSLEKDRTRRYDTANGLANDIQRHLNDEPVIARPPSKLYWFQKLVRRNKLVFIAAGLVTAALIIALGVALLAVVRIRHDNEQIRLAKDDATEKLWGSYLAEARANRTSTETGQRFASLETVQKAAAIRSDLAVRNEVIACLAVSDLRVARQRVVTGHARNELAWMSLDLERYAFGDTNGNITIWAASNNAVVAVLPAPGYTLETVCGFSANGKYCSGRYWREHEGDSSWVWDWEKQKSVVRVFQQADDTNAVDFNLAGDISPDSRFFISGRRDGSISIYDLASGQETRRLSGTRLFGHLILNPEDTRLACCYWKDPQVEIRDVASGQTLRTLTCPAGVSAVAWSPDGKRLATASMDFNIHVWEVETGQRQTTLAGHAGLIMSMAFNHAGNLLASASYDGVVRLWNPDSGRQLAGHRGSTWQIQFSPDDRYLVGWQAIDHYGWLEVASSQECRQLYVPRDDVYTTVPEFSADGRILAVGTDGNIHFWDARSGKEIGSFSLKQCDALVFPPDGRSLITVDRIAGIRQRTLEQVGASAYRLGKPRPFFDAPVIQGASLSSDGRHLAVTQPNAGQALIFDLQDPSAKVVLSGHPMVNRIAISPDGRWAATASWLNPLVRIWDARSGDLLRTITEPARTEVIFSPDGRWLATSSTEYELWEVGTWQPKSPLKAGGPAQQMNFTAFSPDGRVMARVDRHEIQLETITEKPLAALEAPGTIIMTKCQFSPDGSQLAAVQYDQQVQLWDLRLLRQELAQMRLDWDLPPYPPVGKAAAASPVTLEVESDPVSSPPAQSETNSSAHSF